MRAMIALAIALVASSPARGSDVRWNESTHVVIYEFLPTDTRSSARTACILDAAHLALGEFAMPVSVATTMTTTESRTAVDERMQNLTRSQAATPVKTFLLSEAVAEQDGRRVFICNVNVAFDTIEYMTAVDDVVAAERQKYLNSYLRNDNRR